MSQGSQKNLVFILGAGSSSDFGYPLGNQIFAAAHRLVTEVKEEDIKNKLGTALTKVEQVMDSIYSNLPSDKREYPFFEEVVTFIWDSRKSEHQDGNKRDGIVLPFDGSVNKVLETFVEMLTLTLSAVKFSEDSLNNLQHYEKFVKSLRFKEDNISIISLNYDLLIDRALVTCVKEGLIEDYNYGIPLDYLGKESDCFSIIPVDDNGHRFHVPVNVPDSRNKGILLLKPHGSLNLSFCTGHRQEGDFYYYAEDDITSEIMNRTDKAKCSVYNCHDTVKPLIVPPLYMKESYISQTNRSKVWISKRGVLDLKQGVIENYRSLIDKQIGYVLQFADELVVIGYSMPPYDFDLKSLLIKGLMANKNRSNVPVSIITKAEGHELNDLRLRFKHLAGEVRFLGQDGFLNYIKCCNP